jgi:hypothetical protein
MRRQWLEHSSDVNLWPTCDTNVKSLEVKVDEFLHKLEDLITRRWDPGRSRTFIKRVQDNENWTLSQQSQHFFETFLQSVVTRLLSTIIVCLLNVVEDATARTRASEKLKYERAQEIVTGLFIGIRGIEVKVGHDGRSSFAYGRNVLNN